MKKLSDLIAHLEKLRNKHGDIDFDISHRAYSEDDGEYGMTMEKLIVYETGKGGKIAVGSFVFSKSLDKDS